MRPPVLLLALLLAAPAVRADDEDEPAKDFTAYQEENETTCVGPIDGKVAADTVYDLGGFHYVVHGSSARVTRTSKRAVPGEIRLGVVSTVKDDEKETRENLDEYLGKFKAQDVDAILVGGDTADLEGDMSSILGRLASLGVPVLAVVGNLENRSSFNRAVLATWREHKNVLNVDLVRLVQLDGFGVVSLPGYYDKRYTHQSGYCLYTDQDARALRDLAPKVEGPAVLLTHGPPLMSGKLALDWISDGKNVGDPDLADAIAHAKIPFGVFGHINEAGGRATDLTGRKDVKQTVYADALYLNPGSANSLPWPLNGGQTSYGMAAVLTLKGKQAKYDLIKSPQRIGKSDEQRVP